MFLAGLTENLNSWKTGLAGAAMLVVGAGGVGAQEPLDKCQVVTGSYVTTITDIEGVFHSRGLATFGGGGVFLLNDSGQGGILDIFEPFSASQGAWACVAGGEKELKVKAVGLNFTLPKGAGRGGFGRVDYTATYDVAAKTLIGTIALHFSGAGDLESAEPNAAVGAPYEEFQFSGHRIVVP
jgi:hypothetical protein